MAKKGAPMHSSITPALSRGQSRYYCVLEVGAADTSPSFWSTPMGVDYVVIGFDMEVQPLVNRNAAWPLC